jgi:tetratricopeptide (TPR) repeat protein
MLNSKKMEKIEWIEKYMTQAEQLICDDQVEQGLTILQNLLYEEPGYASLHNYLGWAYLYHAKDDAMAELHFRMAIRFASEYAPPYLHMGTLMNRKGRYTEAIGYFVDGLTKPDALKSTLLEGLAHAYELKTEYRRAIRHYKEAASASVAEFEVERMLMGVKRCRRKRIALFFTF